MQTTFSYDQRDADMEVDLAGEREGESGQTQWFGNGGRKEAQPFGAAPNILTLALALACRGGTSSWGPRVAVVVQSVVQSVCAVPSCPLARSQIARLLRDRVAKGPGGSAYGPPLRQTQNTDTDTN